MDSQEPDKTTRSSDINETVDAAATDSAGNLNPPSAPPTSAIIPTPISNNAPNFKYKYPEASPTPPGEDDTEWNKVFTAADSRMYNKHKKDSKESKKYRLSGETYNLALKMLADKKEKAAKAAAGEYGASSTAPAPKASTPKATSTPKAGTSKKASASASATIKKEPSSSSRDVTPGGDKMPMSISEQIKSEGRARKTPSAAPSSNRGTPAPSSAPKMSSPVPPAPKIEKPAPKKKGTAAHVKKQQAKKSKPEEKAGTPSSSRRPSQTPAPKNAISSDDESNDGGEYCICRGPDDHRMMVYCEGGCEDWYHCSCVGINEEDAKELLDRFICPKCKTDTLFTTWKRMCRYYNVAQCRKAARVTDDPPSKYCSDEHKTLFWLHVKGLLRQDDEPSMGGALNIYEVGSILKQCKTAAEIHALGKKPRLPKKEGADPDRPVGLDYVTPEEQEELDNIKLQKQVIESRIQGYQNQQKLLIMINKRAKLAALEPNSDVKDICGYDNRLAMNEAQFFKWSKTEEGKTALGSGILGPRTAETKDIGAHVPYPNQVIQSAPEVSDALNNICLKGRKKCRHFGWRDIHNEDFLFNQKNLKDELIKLTKKEEEIIDDAETREATKDYYAENTVEQLF